MGGAELDRMEAEPGLLEGLTALMISCPFLEKLNSLLESGGIRLSWRRGDVSERRTSTGGDAGSHSSLDICPSFRF